MKIDELKIILLSYFLSFVESMKKFLYYCIFMVCIGKVLLEEKIVFEEEI